MKQKKNAQEALKVNDRRLVQVLPFPQDNIQHHTCFKQSFENGKADDQNIHKTLVCQGF